MVSGWSAACPNGDPNPMDCFGTLGPLHQGLQSNATNSWTDITYLLHKGHVSWGYYVFEGAEPDCESDEAVTCKPVKQGPKTPGIWNPLPNFTDVKQDGQLGNIQSLTNFYTAVHNQGSCGLPNVSWINPNNNVSEHPPSLVSRGQAYVTTLINAIMRSPCWASTAIFLSWDDWGGFYDHVVPPNIDENGYGLRVPGLVISPYAKTGYIDHQQLSHDAYLKFIEDDFLGKGAPEPGDRRAPGPAPGRARRSPRARRPGQRLQLQPVPAPAVLLSAHPEPGPASKPPDPNAPTVETGAASSLTQTAATLNASVNPNEGAVSDCHFEYGSTEAYGSSVPCSSLPGSGTSPVAVSAALGTLSANTTYHFRILATNAGGTGQGGDQAFTTLPNAPIVETGAASSLTQTAATLNASVNPNAGDVSDCYFEYGSTEAYGSSAPCSSLPGSGSSPVGVSASATSLSPNTTYHVRILATNAGGTNSGSDHTFKTLPNPPTVETAPASSLTQTSATLTATVNPNGGEVGDCHFEYGTSKSYGSSVPCSSLPGSGTSPVAVSAPVSGLSANTTYHFRILASNPGGGSSGADRTFTSSPNAPTVVTKAASAITQTTATLNASVNPNEGAVSDCHFEYGTSESYGSSAPCSSLPGSGTSPMAVSAPVSGLSANTTYHFRILATNPGGSSADADLTFKTSPNPPTVVTKAASSIAQTSATLNANVNPNGGAVSGCRFEYGTSETYGSSAPCSSLPGSGTSPMAVSAPLSGLSANTTYHFRILASNPGGNSSGSDRAFKTLPDPPNRGNGAGIVAHPDLGDAQRDGGPQRSDGQRLPLRIRHLGILRIERTVLLAARIGLDAGAGVGARSKPQREHDLSLPHRGHQPGRHEL